MTTLIAIDGQARNETRAKAVARRLRSEIAGINITKSQAAKYCGVSQPWMTRRLTGKTALAVDEIDMICERLGLSYDYIACGIREVPPPTPPGGGMARPYLPLPRMDSNHQPPEPFSRFPPPARRGDQSPEFDEAA